MFTLDTKRLTLRDMTEVDFDAVHRYASDPEVCRYMSFGPNTVEDTRGFLKRAIATRDESPRPDYTLLVCLPDGEAIGGCGLHGTSRSDGVGYIGYLFRPEYWGKGYGSEVALALVTFGFDTLGMQRIWSTCDAANVASARIMEGVGMVREKTFDEKTKHGQHMRTSCQYGISSETWGSRG